ncbi:MAG: hypothetical protein PHV07_00070 [Oscillospiraceae bacterium]|nr:hypothetical protein [Oscillospiraceae bacterium]
MRQGGGRRRAIARRERQRSLANKRPRRLVDFYLELVLIYNYREYWLSNPPLGCNTPSPVKRETKNPQIAYKMLSVDFFDSNNYCTSP